MNKAFARGNFVALAGVLLSATFVQADEIILLADFDSDPLGAPSLLPPSLPENDSLSFGQGSYSIVTDPLVAGNQFLEGISPIMAGSMAALVDPSFNSSSDTSGSYEIGWTSSVGPSNSATFAVNNAGSTSLFIKFDGPSKTINVNNASGQAIPLPAVFEPENFQDFKLVLDFETEVFDVEIDGVQIAQSLPLIAGSNKGLTGVAISYSTDISLTSGIFLLPGSTPPVGILSLDQIYAVQIEKEQTIEAIFEVLPKAFAHGRRSVSRRTIPVVLQGTSELDVSEIELDSLKLNGLALKTTRGKPLAYTFDITGPTKRPDGLPDLVCFFQYDSADWQPPADGTHILSGFLFNGDILAGAADTAKRQKTKKWCKR